MGGAARRGIHRLESPACAGARGSRQIEPVQRIEPALSQRSVHRGPAGAGISRLRGGARTVGRPAIVQRLRELRGRELVDYRGVAELKFEILALLYRDFRDRHLAAGTARAREFRAFVAAGGELLQMHARFDALDRYFRATLGAASGWLNWPEEYRDVNGSAAARFAAEHPDEVEFYAYLQWLAHEQLCGAQALARELGMPIGLYGDYAVGANPSGSETWADQEQLLHGRRNRRAAGSAGAQGTGLGHTAAGSVRDAGAAAARLRAPDPQQHALLRRTAPGSCDVAVPPVVGRAPGSRPPRAPTCTIPCSSCSRCCRWKARAVPAWWSARTSAWCPTRCAGPCPNSGSITTRCCCSKSWTADFDVPTSMCGTRWPRSPRTTCRPCAATGRGATSSCAAA